MGFISDNIYYNTQNTNKIGIIMNLVMEYRKRPVKIKALKYTGTRESVAALIDFVGESLSIEFSDGWYPFNVMIKTLEGVMHVNIGDYIIKGIQGEFYPCAPSIFESTYDIVV